MGAGLTHERLFDAFCDWGTDDPARLASKVLEMVGAEDSFHAAIEKTVAAYAKDGRSRTFAITSMIGGLVAFLADETSPAEACAFMRQAAEFVGSSPKDPHHDQ